MFSPDKEPDRGVRMGYVVPCEYAALAGVMEAGITLKLRLPEGAVAIATYNVILLVGVNAEVVAKFA
jgi:hypothetical protein